MEMVVEDLRDRVGVEFGVLVCGVEEGVELMDEPEEGGEEGGL